jgi:uncharacterized protein (TIGR02594 family)
MSTIEPAWLIEARKNISTTETKGPRHTAAVLEYWRSSKLSGIKDDETPWCAAFVGAMLERTGIKSTRSDSAKSYLTWGQPLKQPLPGCVAVFWRDGGGHVGFVVGQDSDRRLLVLGGNQSDAVNVKAFDRARVLSYRWPTGVELPVGDLPKMSAVEASTSEV